MGGIVAVMLVVLPPARLDLGGNGHRRGQDPPARPGSRQSDRRRRGGRAAGLRRQGAGRERDRRRGPPHRHRHRARRQEADPRRRRRRRHGCRGRAAGDRAARDEQDRARRRSRRDPHARLPRRGAAQHRVGVALHAAHARARGEQSGTEIKVNAGAIASVREVGAPEGTCIEVADLFYNLPARRKFLKSDTAETTQISRLVTQLALGYPEVGFTLTSERPQPAAVPAGRQRSRERFFQLFGDRADLVEVRKDAGGLKIEGYVAALGDQGPTRGAAERLRQPPHRQGPDDRARDHRGLQRRDDQGAQPRGPPVPDDRARSRRRQRPSDEGGGAFSRAVAGARSPAPRARRRARRRAARRTASSVLEDRRPPQPGDPDRRSGHPRRALRRHRREPLEFGSSDPGSAIRRSRIPHRGSRISDPRIRDSNHGFPTSGR